MTYSVLIPTAGTGSRLGDLTKYLNKSLVHVANQPVISRIIGHFPQDSRFVVVLGHEGELVKEYLSHAHPESEIVFQSVYPFEGPGSGLGLSILAAESLLQEPFVFTSCDTLVLDQVPAPDCNWVGAADTAIEGWYRGFELDDDGRILRPLDKGDAANCAVPYIGLAGIHDYQFFWQSMKEGKDIAIQEGEFFALSKFDLGGLDLHTFQWFDTGNQDSLELTRNYFRNDQQANVLEKPSESIWILQERVIKYSADVKFISDRVARSQDLQGFVPPIQRATNHMYSYDFVEGQIFSICGTPDLFRQLLRKSIEFWEDRSHQVDHAEFEQLCHQFYYDKTIQRVKNFFELFNLQDDVATLNGSPTKSIWELLNDLDWQRISKGRAVRFHGDFHFENIIFNEKSNLFTFLDWRQDFAGHLEIGDQYYDFAKLLHGLIVSHKAVLDEQFSYSATDGAIEFSIERPPQYIELEELFVDWLQENNFDVQKVYWLAGLIFLNIASLHHAPYAQFLFALGKKMITPGIK
jgi:thiamine kinase-like enzyme